MSSSYKLMLFIFKFLFIKKVLCFPLENESHTLYDQRQTGKYNIHISLRDVAIIEVDKNEFSDDTVNNADEYYYDEEDLTISPISNWISTTVLTPQLIVNNSKNQTVDLQYMKNNKQVVKHSSSPHKQLPNLALLESSSVDANPNSSLLSLSGRTTLEYDMGASIAKEPVLQVPSEMRLMNIPLKKNTIGNSKNNLLKDHNINTDIPSILSDRTGLPKVPKICRNYELRDANGNCRSLKRQMFLKSLFDMLKLIRMKN